jgi:hypothetical protein
MPKSGSLFRPPPVRYTSAAAPVNTRNVITQPILVAAVAPAAPQVRSLALTTTAPAPITEPPPPPQVEVVREAPSPDYAWIPGHWQHRDDGQWIWIHGTWAITPRPEAIWVPGRWIHRIDSWVWIRGYWR